MKNIVIVGAGTAGTTMASKLRRALPEREWRIVVLDRDDVHVYQPGLLFVPFGHMHESALYRSRRALLPRGIELVLAPIARIVPDENAVVMQDGTRFGYDVLILATGAEIAPSSVEGLTGAGWRETAFDFYTPAGAVALASALSRFTGGKLVVHIAEMPIKCPVAPLEFAFHADAHFTERGIRDRVEIVYATPLDAAFTKPVASRMLGGLMASRGIRIEPDFNVASVDGARRVMRGYDGRELDYDLLVTVPPHQGSALIRESALGDAQGFIPTDKHTLVTHAHGNVFALGDATDLPSSKAGSVAHFQSDILFENILAFIGGRAPTHRFDGHSNCFIETGFDKAMLIDFNYDTEPLPGRFPLPGVGPFTLLEESRVNHWGKLAFEWMYWNLLVKGEPIPLDAHMTRLGKWS